MALIIKAQLSKSRGLAKVIVFHGLEFNIVVHPTIYGEPILTSQAFYYLEQLEAVAEIRFENSDKRLADGRIEYLIDNYLFKYSTLHDESRMSTKVTEFKYWKDDYNDMYATYDQRNTKVLVLDKYNDESVLSIEPLYDEDNTDFCDWCLVKNYSDSIIDSYVSSMRKLVNKKILIKVLPTSERDGYFGKIRMIECDEGLLDYHQAHSLDSRFDPRDIVPNQEDIILKAQYDNGNDVYLPVETVHLDKLYNPILLSYYFSGLKEINPLLSFIGFYNVLEYYFEEAPLLLGTKSKFERDQLECVVSWLVSHKMIYSFFNEKRNSFKAKAKEDIKTSSSVKIPGFDVDKSKNLVKDLSAWLYSIRCSVVHSKKSRKGKVVSIFEPYSDESQNIMPSIPIVKWLSIACIHKDIENSTN
jgi:hypothetical protein